ncbi:phage tail protein [Escherichia coli]|uniref:phage tail protein n=1 Tax=Escherichia coli TaxID=562 RepID=UPI003B283C19
MGNHRQLTGDDKRRVNYGDKGLDQAIENLSRVRKNAIPAASAWPLTAWPQRRLISLRHRLPGDQGEPETGKGTVQTETATVRNPNAKIIVKRGDLPVIKLGIRMLGRRPNSILKAVSIVISGHLFSD